MTEEKRDELIRENQEAIAKAKANCLVLWREAFQRRLTNLLSRQKVRKP